MKLDTSGLETTMPVIGFGSNNDMLDGFSSVPSFDLPRTTDVRFSFEIQYLSDSKMVLFCFYLIVSFALFFSLMGFRKNLWRW